MSFSLPPNRFKAGLTAGRPQIGCWVTLASPSVAEIVAEAGFDWILIDMEHSPNEVPGVTEQIRATHRGTAEAIVRVPALDPAIIKRLLDVGVRSFMVPNVQSAEEARLAVAATRYPPRGIRGVAGSTRANGWGRMAGYFESCEEEICVILQLETRKAIAATAEIAAVDGVDALFIGPNDLAADIGHTGNMRASEAQALVGEGLAAIKAAGRAAGLLDFQFDAVVRRFAEGFDFIAVDGDSTILARSTNETVRRYGEALAR